MTPYTRRITLCEKACRCYLQKNCMTLLNRTTYTYFRWGGFPPWEIDLPNKGDKVVSLYNDGFQSFMYLMKTIAIGEQSVPFLEDIDELHQVDDCTVYVLSNVVGPVIIDNSELNLLKELLKASICQMSVSHNHCRISSWRSLSVISIQLILMNCDKLNDSIQINRF